MNVDPRDARDVESRASLDESPQARLKAFLANSGPYYMVVGVGGLAMTAIGITPRKLQFLGPKAMWAFVPLVLVGCVLFIWTHRRRPKFVALVVGPALAAMPLLFGIGYLVNPKFTPQQDPRMGSREPRRPAQVQSQWFSPFALYLGELDREVPVLSIEVEGDVSQEELKGIAEWLRDQLSEAKTYSLMRGDPTSSSQNKAERTPMLTLGPVKDTREFLAKIQFAELRPIAPDRVRMTPRRPLPSAEDSVANRAPHLLGELQSNDPKRQATAAKRLESMAPLTRREEIATELFRAASDIKRYREFFPAWERWATLGQVDGILETLNAIEAAPIFDTGGNRDRTQADLRHQLFRVLVKLAPDNARPWYCDFVAKDARFKEASAIEYMGGMLIEADEAQFVQLLDLDVPTIHRAVCVSFAKKGTAEASMAALQSLTTSSDQLLANEAKLAIESIRRRRK